LENGKCAVLQIYGLSLKSTLPFICGKLYCFPKILKIKIYRTIILPVVLYGCKTWSVTLREERRLRVFENSVLRRVFGLKIDGGKGDWRKLYNEKLNTLRTGDANLRFYVTTVQDG